MCHLCAVVSSLAVGKKNHPQGSSRVNQQITTHLSYLRDAPGPSSWNGQNQSLLRTPAPAQGDTVAAREFQAPPSSMPCLSCGVSPRQPRVYSQLATPFSTTAITNLVTVLTKHLVWGQQQWSEPDRKH